MLKRLGLIALVVAVILGLGLCLGIGLSRWAGLGSGPKMRSTPALLEEVRTLSDLVTVQFVMEKVVVMDVPPDSMLGKMFAGENRVLMVAHGIVKGGVDLGRLGAGDLKVSGRKVAIKLPPAQITDAYLDDKRTQIIERTTGLFRSFDKDLEQNVRQIAVEDIRRSAREGGILRQADERARAQLRSLFRQLGFEEVVFQGN
jgi:hypothetical protein